MRLRLGLALLLAVVAFVPFALVVDWTREANDAIAREAREERADAIANEVRAYVDEELGELGHALEIACRDQGAAAESLLRAARVDAPAGAPALQVAFVLDSPAWAGAGARPLLALSESARSAMRADWTRIELPGARGRDYLGRAWRCGDHEVLGAFQASAFLTRGSARDAAEIALLAPDAPPPEGADRRIVRAFRDVSGRDALVVAVTIPPARIGHREQASLELNVQVLALATVVIALLLGLSIGGRVTRPLGELEKAAQRIGRGELDVKIDRASGSAGATFSAFNRMAEELRSAQSRAKRAERVAAWRDIARRIAHEIKNPLTPIRMSIETMRRTKQRQHPDFDEIFDESTRTVLEEVERLERIVTEFSRFARLPRPQPTSLDVREVVAQVVQLHSPGGDATITDTSPRLPIKMTLANDAPRVRADRDQLTQVLVNLVQNALDAAQSKRGDEGHVEVEVEPTTDGGVRVTVSDDGPGIPAEERARVLEPYYTTKARGTGLGLSIVDRIVSEHGGTLEIGESRRGGAQITFTLTREGPGEDAEASATS
ncbi:sensor histidine kinase [Sandaracinus amylolyticus]|uniref:sensor histidine kinase n=1 Tax=Sandaracinus amylolyticus TaxID=927083 RepID=UPI001F300C47|nr:ATP-binding protein [Sandaracinus amylolyticus]UJR82049.1 Nitrogen regulation protein ntrY [Sandaracinus amylolyticus]